MPPLLPIAEKHKNQLFFNHFFVDQNFMKILNLNFRNFVSENHQNNVGPPAFLEIASKIVTFYKSRFVHENPMDFKNFAYPKNSPRKIHFRFCRTSAAIWMSRSSRVVRLRPFCSLFRFCHTSAAVLLVFWRGRPKSKPAVRLRPFCSSCNYCRTSAAVLLVSRVLVFVLRLRWF